MTTAARLVFVHPSDEMYGADRVLLDLFRALDDESRDIAEFWLPTDVPHVDRPLCEQLEALGATVRHVDVPIMRRSYRNPRSLLRLARRAIGAFRALGSANPDLVYLTTSATYLSAPLARLARVPMVVGHKQEMWSSGDARVLGACARWCHRLIAISEPVRDNLPPALRDRTDVVVNATPAPSSIAPLDGRSGPLTFVIASRWNAWKGHGTLLAAWDRLERPGQLVVLGGSPPSGESVDVPRVVDGLHDPASVSIVGEVAEIGSYIDRADVVVVPSDDPEPFGLVAIEAFARGRPVIGSDAGGLAQIIDHGRTGWTFPARDVEALARIIEGLDRDEVRAAGAAARREYEQRFTAERFVADWRSVIEPLLPFGWHDAVG